MDHPWDQRLYYDPDAPDPSETWSTATSEETPEPPAPSGKTRFWLAALSPLLLLILWRPSEAWWQEPTAPGRALQWVLRQREWQWVWWHQHEGGHRTLMEAYRDGHLQYRMWGSEAQVLFCNQRFCLEGEVWAPGQPEVAWLVHAHQALELEGDQLRWEQRPALQLAPENALEPPRGAPVRWLCHTALSRPAPYPRWDLPRNLTARPSRCEDWPQACAALKQCAPLGLCNNVTLPCACLAGVLAHPPPCESCRQLDDPGCPCWARWVSFFQELHSTPCVSPTFCAEQLWPVPVRAAHRVEVHSLRLRRPCYWHGPYHLMPPANDTIW